MKEMKTQVSVWGSRFTMILISLGALSPVTPVTANPLLNPFQNRTGSHRGFSIEPVASYFLTSENFDEDSARVPTPNTTSNSRLMFDLNGSFGITDDLFAFGRLSLHSARVTVLDQVSQSGFGLSDQLAGFAYRALHSDSGISLNLQAEVTIPAYNNTDAKNSGNAYLGDGTIDVTGGGFLEFPLGSSGEIYLEGGGGYTYRSKGFSACLPYSLKLKRDPAVKGLMYEAGVTGQLSLKTDIATENLQARSILDQDRLAGSGGSNLINALNPSWIQVTGKLGYKNRHGQILYAGASAPFFGTNAAAGFAITIGASLDFGQKAKAPTEERAQPSAPKRPSVSKKMSFSTYDLDAKILNSNDQLYLIRINKGSMDGVESGQYFDIYEDATPIARAKVTQVKDEEAILSVVEYFEESSIETEFIARRLVR
jgi:hypothetical protein